MLVDNQRTTHSRQGEKRLRFCINDHADVLVEILQRLDGRSIGVAACVCRLWRSITRNDALWEHLCFRHVHPPPPPSSGVRPVVAALGGYRRLYMVCVRPVMSRLGRRRGRAGGDSERAPRVCTQHVVQLWLSLFCVDYYEKLNGRLGGGDAAAAPSSLTFLHKPVINI